MLPENYNSLIRRCKQARIFVQMSFSSNGHNCVSEQSWWLLIERNTKSTENPLLQKFDTYYICLVYWLFSIDGRWSWLDAVYLSCLMCHQGARSNRCWQQIYDYLEKLHFNTFPKWIFDRLGCDKVADWTFFCVNFLYSLIQNKYKCTVIWVGRQYEHQANARATDWERKSCLAVQKHQSDRKKTAK